LPKFSSALIPFPFPFFRLCEGLQCLGVLAAVRGHPDLWQEAFIPSSAPLKADDVERLYRAERSEPGSNKFTAERKALGHFTTFLRDMEG
jgi:hypothetical protein